MWRSRAIVVVVVTVLAEVTLIAAGVRPHLLLITAILLVGSAVVFLALDLGDNVVPLKWPTDAGPPRKSDGADWRVGTLRMLLLNERRSDGMGLRLHGLLVGLIDDHLRDEHRVDRDVDPESAAAIIGPELTAFVNSTHQEWRLEHTRDVARIVTLIEHLGDTQ